MILYYIIIAIVILDFLWTQYLAYRNRKKMSSNIPEELKGIYNEEQYAKQQAYQKENSRFGLFSSAISFAGMLIVLILQGFGWFDEQIREYTDNYLLTSGIFIGVLYLISEFISLPFAYYDVFVIEEKYGFNKSTKVTFWLDQIKGLFLSAIIGGLILILLVWFYNNFDSLAWLYTWGLLILFTLTFTLFYSSIIVPLFNKQTPLEEGELRTEIEAFSNKASFDISNIYVMDASKRTSKANAYFTGLGNKKRIVLYDTLINDLETEEVVAVLAHEIGHYKKKHTLQSIIISILYTGILLFILSFFIQSRELVNALGGQVPSFHLGVIAFSILFTPISLVLGLVMNALSRKNEYEADAFAARFDLGKPLMAGLKKLSTKSLSNLNPDKWNVFFYYSHPTLLQRMQKLNNINNF